jgi:RHS repeat-associated protein
VTLPNYEDGPYYREYECPPVDVGNGWQLNFPWIGGEYIHYLDGTLYKKGTNHTGHHFTFEEDVLTAASGVLYHFTGGVVTSITDTDGNMIAFGYTNGRLTTITDTVGRVISLSYNSKGQLTQISYGSYTVMYAYSIEALTSVTDPLGRVTSYAYDQRNNWLLTRVSYPTGGYTDYTYSYFSQVVDPPDPLGCFELRKYMVTDQAVYSPDLVNHTCYTYEGDFDGITKTTATVKNEQNFTKAVHEFTVDSNGLTREHAIKDAGGAQLRKVEYTYSDRKEVIQEDVYMGTSYAYTQKYVHDSWGNVIYKENGEGEKTYCCYAHTDSQNVFRDCNGDIPGFSNTFFDTAVPSHIHTALSGSVSIQDDKVIETYYNYNNGHMIETYQVFQDPADYSVFSGVFDENGQTSFPVDLTGVQLQGDAVLKLTGIPTPNEITKTETHSTYKYCTWFNEGYWQQNTFYAKYIEKKPPFSIDYEPVGPFFHYPGTPGYTNYTAWVSGYYQYVKTTYTESPNKYPEQVDYSINGGELSTVIPNLGEKTVYYSIPVEELTAGLNTLGFQESSMWVTRCEWELYVPYAVAPLEDVSAAFTYNAYGNLTSTTDTQGNTTYYGYDTQYHAYVTSITNALNNTVTAEYDYTRGFLTSITDAKGYTTHFEYDIQGRATKKINPDLIEEEVIYNDQNNTVIIYDELDHKIIKYYDGINRLTKIEQYISETINLTETYVLNYQNNVKTKTDPGGHIYSFEYDSLGRLTKIFNPDSTFVEAQYNDAAHTVAVLDENQHKREYAYNWNNQLVSVKEYIDVAHYYQTLYTYDSSHHVTSITDANGNTTYYSYDSMFGVTQITYPDTTIETFSYNTVGNLLQSTNAHGTTAFTYDEIYQVIEIQYPDVSQVTFGYDANSNRTSMIDAAGSTAYTYDNRNRLTVETRTMGEDLYSVSYNYDDASQITSITYPDQSVVSYEYDFLNRLTAIPGYAQFTYNEDSLLASMTYSNGVVTAYHYDDRHRLTTLHAQKGTEDLLLMNYHYDSARNITQLEYNRRLPDQQWEQSVETFGYDWLNRLVSAQGDYGLLSYSYDSVGNRLSLNGVTYTYNSMNELLSISDGTTYTYDEVGNMLAKSDSVDTWTYTHDAQNKLTHVEKNQDVIAHYVYDGDGKRIQKTEWVESVQEYETIIYVYSGLHLLYEKNLSTDQEATYIYGPTGRIAMAVDGLMSYYHTDHLGSTRVMTDESGTPLCEISYRPFGQAEKRGDGKNSLYTGKDDDSTGLYYFGARYYDPQNGRWIERDLKGGVLENPASLNRYVYCYNNPLLYVDPDGLAPDVHDRSAYIVWAAGIGGALLLGLSGAGAPAAVLWGTGALIWRLWLSRNWTCKTTVSAGKLLVKIHARGNTPGIGEYSGSIQIDPDDTGSYKGDIRNDSTTLVAVDIIHLGSGTLDLIVSGSGSVLLNVYGSGDVCITIDEECTAPVVVNAVGSGTITIYVPEGSSICITGSGSVDIEYYDSENKEDES